MAQAQKIDFQPIDFQPEEETPPPKPKPAPKNNMERFAQEYGDVEAMGTPIVPTQGLASVAKAAVPGIRSIGSKVMGILSKPAVGGTIGAVTEGYRSGGDPMSTVMGGMAGAAGSKKLGSSRNPATLQAPKRLIETLNDPAEFRAAVEQKQALKALTDRLRTQPPKPYLVPKPSPAQELEEELAKRIDWRTTDAVPIDAMKRAQGMGGTILEAGESQIGLGERLAQAMKKAAAGDVEAAKEAELLARALRQRMHIRAPK